jgi:hypothetical protein
LNLITQNNFFLSFKLEHEIDLEAFNILSEDMLIKLIPKMGVYAKFKEQYDKYITHNNDNNINPTKRKPADASQIPSTSAKRLKKDVDFSLELDLLSLLKKTKKGEVVLTNQLNLSNSDRQALCQIIVDHFVNNGITMGLFEFQNIKSKIKDLFTSEASNIDIYYTQPDRSIKNSKPKGKLPDKFFNFTKLLKKNNILERSRANVITNIGNSIVIGNTFTMFDTFVSKF